MAEKREFLLGMLIGSAVGAAVALLYAPQAGDETREVIRQKTTDAKGRVVDMAGTVSSTVAEKAGAVRSTVAEKAGSVRSSAQEMVERGRGFVETKKAQVAAAVDAGKQAYVQKKEELEADVNEDLNADLDAQLGTPTTGSTGTTTTGTA